MLSTHFLSPALAFLLTAFTETIAVCIGSHQASHFGPPDVVAMFFVVLWVSSMNAFVSFFVTCFYARCSVNVLRLD